MKSHSVFPIARWVSFALCLMLFFVMSVQSQTVIGGLSFDENAIAECEGVVERIESVEGGCISTDAVTPHLVILHMKSRDGNDACQVSVMRLYDDEDGEIEDRSAAKKRLKADGWKLVGTVTFTGENSIPPCFAFAGLVGVYKRKNYYIATLIR